MLVTLMCEDKLYNLPLPEKIQGYYWIEDVDLEITDRLLLCMEGNVPTQFVSYICGETLSDVVDKLDKADAELETEGVKIKIKKQ